MCWRTEELAQFQRQKEGARPESIENKYFPSGEKDREDISYSCSINVSFLSEIKSQIIIKEPILIRKRNSSYLSHKQGCFCEDDTYNVCFPL